MREKVIIISLLLISGMLIDTGAQNVSINEDGTSPDNSAILDLKSTSRGLLTPRMTAVQRTSISSPATGLLVYDTDSSAFYYYNGTSWDGLTKDTVIQKIYGSVYENNFGGTNSAYVVSSSYIGDTTFTAGELSGITFSDDNTNGDYLEIPSGEGGTYMIQLTMSFRGDTGSDNFVGVFLNSGSDPMAGLAFERTTANNSAGSAAASGIVQLSAGDLVRVKFKTGGTNKDFEIITQALSLLKIN